MSKIGILGGTFDPIHRGHIALARAAYEQYGLDKVLVMVSNNPPHKKNISDVSHRSNMVKLAIVEYPYMEYSDFELKREGYIYTADTLTLLKKENPNNEYYFIIGGDSLKDLDKWYHPEVVLKSCVILAALREGVDEADYRNIVKKLYEKYSKEEINVDIRKLIIEAIDISSGEIRDTIRINNYMQGYISEDVYKYIIDNDLYKNEKAVKKYFASIRSQLKNVLSNSRYEHTLGVEFTSAALAMRYGEDIFKARLAGVLHDCAKCIDDDEKLRECLKYDIPVTSIEENLKYLLHSKLGAFYAKKVYNVKDEEVLSAIRYHTTGRPNMTLLEKIVFVADYIEPARDRAKNLAEIRKTSFIDIDKAIVMILSDTLEYLKASGDVCDETTLLTYKYYVNNVEDKITKN